MATETMLKIETEPCSRCGGTGRMPFSVQAGRCFRCGGSGATATKRGRAARARFESIRDALPYAERAVDLQPGDRILARGITEGGDTYLTTGTVVDVDRTPAVRGSVLRNGEMVPAAPTITVIYQDQHGRTCRHYGAPDAMWRRPLSREQKQEILRTILEAGCEGIIRTA